MMSTSGGLKPSAVAGGPSVTRFTQSSCTGMSPSGIPSAAVKKIENTSTDANFLTAIRKHVSKVEDEKAEKEKLMATYY